MWPGCSCFPFSHCLLQDERCLCVVLRRETEPPAKSNSNSKSSPKSQGHHTHTPLVNHMAPHSHMDSSWCVAGTDWLRLSCICLQWSSVFINTIFFFCYYYYFEIIFKMLCWELEEMGKCKFAGNCLLFCLRAYSFCLNMYVYTHVHIINFSTGPNWWGGQWESAMPWQKGPGATPLLWLNVADRCCVHQPGESVQPPSPWGFLP